MSTFPGSGPKRPPRPPPTAPSPPPHSWDGACQAALSDSADNLPSGAFFYRSDTDPAPAGRAPVDAAPRRPAGQVPTHTGFGPPRPQMATGTPSVWYSWLLGTCGPPFNTWFIKIDGCAVCWRQVGRIWHLDGRGPARRRRRKDVKEQN